MDDHAMSEPPIRDRILSVLAECGAWFDLEGLSEPTAADLDTLTDEEAMDLEAWARECLLTCTDVVDWALGDLPEPLASRLERKRIRPPTFKRIKPEERSK
jgi:hypothetical protein